MLDNKNEKLKANRMTPEALLEFLKEEQKNDLAMEECIEIIKNFESSANKTSFTKEGFTHFLMFNDWQVLLPHCRKVLLLPYPRS